MDKKIKALKELIIVQSRPGSYNCNEYMCGMANGLILALSVITGEEPKYLDKPEKYLDDMPPPTVVSRIDGVLVYEDGNSVL